jgi:hypothetical protein
MINAGAIPLVVLTDRPILALVRMLVILLPSSAVGRAQAEIIVLDNEVFRIHCLLAWCHRRQAVRRPEFMQEFAKLFIIHYGQSSMGGMLCLVEKQYQSRPT